jgi:Rieske 2Fe-2S family protein
MTTQRPDEKVPYNGLPKATPTLPSSAYIDPDHYQRELRDVWFRNWLFVCRAADLSKPRDFLTYQIGDQSILLLRDLEGGLQAFHNTCRHRGSRLCQEARGRLPGKTIICPYHSWTYDLDGKLARLPAIDLGEDFRKEDYPLYRVAVREWRGLVFIHLAGEDAPPLEAAMDPSAGVLDNWPLEDLAVGHHFRRMMNCNWKVFWENYNECYHCPRVHPGLSRIVPIYGRGIMEPNDDPDWEAKAGDPDPRYRGGLMEGAETWSETGRGTGIAFAGLSKAEKAAGHHFITMLPTLFLVGYLDHVRAIAIKPLSAEETEMEGYWLFPRQALDRAPEEVRRVAAFGEQVMAEDAAACELNQKGLHALEHKAGVLLPQEYEVKRFHDWVRGQVSAS